MSNKDKSVPIETELLWLPKIFQSAQQLFGVKNIAIQIGAKSSKAVLIDGAKENDRLLIFHLKFLASSESEDDCLKFLVSYDDRDCQLNELLVNKLTPQLSRLSTLADKIREVDFTEHVPKSAALLADLAELHPQELFHLTDDLDRKIDQFRFCLIDSNPTRCRITRISRSNGCQGQSEDLPESTSNQLLAVKRSLAVEFGKADGANEWDSEDEALTLWLSRLSGSTGEDIVRIARPAVNVYTNLIESELQRPTSGTMPTLIAIADSFFAAKSCRDAVLKDFQGNGRVVIRFIKDTKFIGMLGALAAEAE